MTLATSQIVIINYASVEQTGILEVFECESAQEDRRSLDPLGSHNCHVLCKDETNNKNVH